MESSKVIGSFPISIGTSLALESLFEGPLPPYDPDRKIPNKININEYEILLININTLFRNLLGADKNILNNKPYKILDLILEEVELIREIFKDKGAKEPIYYNNDYSFIKDHGCQARIRKHQKNEEVFYQYLLKQLDGKSYFNFRGMIKSTHNKPLIITHHPWDLLSYKNYQQLDLLESHTGVLKKRKDWWSKYHKVGRANMSHLPFNKSLLTIFGDNYDTLGMDLLTRKTVLAIGERERWHPLTTEAKVINDLKKNDVSYP